MNKIVPYNGSLIFEGEVYEPLNENWADDVVHEELRLMTFMEYLRGS